MNPSERHITFKTLPMPLQNPLANEIIGSWLVAKVSIGVTPALGFITKSCGIREDAFTGASVLLSVVYPIFVALPSLVSIFITHLLLLLLYIL